MTQRAQGGIVRPGVIWLGDRDERPELVERYAGTSTPEMTLIGADQADPYADGSTPETTRPGPLQADPYAGVRP